jgi:hypothetical protein
MIRTASGKLPVIDGYTVGATAWTDRGDDGLVTSVRLYQDLSPLYTRSSS